MNNLFEAIEGYSLRLFGVKADLSDLKHIPVFYRVIDNTLGCYEYELHVDATADPPLIIETVDGEVVDVSSLLDLKYAVEWFRDADPDELFDPISDAMERMGMESRRAG